MKRYLALWLSVTVALVAVVAATNAIVDPYGLFRWVDRPGFNAVKPQAGPHGAIAKPYQALSVAPRTLLLGNSRMEVGFDPQSAAWPVASRPVFNGGLPGTGPTMSVTFVERAVARAAEGRGPAPRTIVWGVDFPDFLNDPHDPPQRRSFVSAESPAWFDGQRLRDGAGAALTLGALIDSMQTLASQRNRYAATLTPLGFNPFRQYVEANAQEGVRAIFDHADVDNTVAYLRRPHSLFDASGDGSPDLDALQRVLDLCRRDGIALKLVIYPIHAHLLEVIRATGHWAEFQQWKRIMVDAAAREASASGGAAVPIWDFSGFDRYTTETLPAKGDRSAAMQWFWEGGHFKSELGDLVLARILGEPGADPAFGTLLDRSNIDRQIATMDAQEIAYRRDHPEDVDAIERIAARSRARH